MLVTMNVVTIITPTTGKPSLNALVESLDRQSHAGSCLHRVWWDDVRHPDARPPASYDTEQRISVVLPPGLGRNGAAVGSPLRAVGLMAARTEWVTFADDDVRWQPEHIETLLRALAGHRWASTLRTVWSPTGERLGVDRFESVGDDPGRRVGYEMIDNSSMIFARELGVGAAALYRETQQYNDDRLMYGYLKQHAGPRGRTNAATVDQICPERLIEFFRRHCASA